MRKYLPIIAILSLIKLAVHLVGNRNYGFHRDELLHLTVAQHLDFGYMEFPPFIAIVGRLALMVFGESLFGMRFFATLAGIMILVLCCFMAFAMGGKRHAIWISGVAVLAFLPYYRNHCLFQPVVFDQLFWTLGFYFLLRYINSKNHQFLIYLGITAGFGLMNKYTFLVWGIGIFAGLLFYEKGKLFKSKWLYVSGLIAFVIFLPNIIWQYQHHFPFFKHLEALKKSQLDDIGPYDFLVDQTTFLFTFALSVIGLAVLFLDKKLMKYRSLGIAIVVIFVVMWMMQSKAYYFFAAYPVLFAAGAVKIESWFEKQPRWNCAVLAILILPVAYHVPKAIPLLQIDDFVRYAHLKEEADGRIKLSDDYADMFGWDEQVSLIDSIYQSFPQKDRKDVVIFTKNYGEASAVAVLGKKYGLPQPICVSGSFWLWGTGDASGQTAITIGIDSATVGRLFAERQWVKTITHRYAIDEENNIPVYICKKPSVDLKQLWPTLETHVFD